MRILFEKSVGSDGGYKITVDGNAVCIYCDFLFDASTGERTQFNVKFDLDKYTEAIKLLLKDGECHLSSENKDFLNMKIKGQSSCDIHFGMNGGTQFIDSIEINKLEYLLPTQGEGE